MPKHPQAATRGAYLNGSPYTKMYVDIYGFGRMPIDANPYVNSNSMTVNVAVDLFTGTGELTIEAGNFRSVHQSCMFGVPIQLSESTQDLVKPLYNTVVGTAALLQGHVFSGVSAIDTALHSCLPQIQTSGSFGSKMAFNESPEVDFEFYSIVDEDNATIGRPLCQIRQISTISGYILCANVDIDSVGTKAEKDAIVRYLEGGFFYE